MAKKVKLRAFENPVPIASSNEAAPAKRKSRKASKSGTPKSTIQRTNLMAKLRRKSPTKGRKLTVAQKRARKASRTRKQNLLLKLKKSTKRSSKRKPTARKRKPARRNPVAVTNPIRRRRPRKVTQAQRLMILSAAMGTKRRKPTRRKTRRNPVALANPRRRRTRRAAPSRALATQSNPRRRRYAKANPANRRRSSAKRRTPGRSRRNPAGNVIADVLTAFFFGALGYVVMRLIRDGISWGAAKAGLEGDRNKDYKSVPGVTDANADKQTQKNHLMIHALLRTLVPVLLLVVSYKAIWERRASNARAQSILQNMWLGAGVGTVLGTLEDWINVFTYGEPPSKSIQFLKSAFRSNQALDKSFVTEDPLNPSAKYYPNLFPLSQTNPLVMDGGFQPFGAVRNPTLLDGGFQPFGAVRNPTLLDGGFQAFGAAKENPIVTDPAHGSFLDDFAAGYMNKSYRNPDVLDMDELQSELDKISDESAGNNRRSHVMTPSSAQRNAIAIEDRAGSPLSIDSGMGIDSF